MDIIELFKENSLNQNSVTTIRTYIYSLRQFEKWLSSSGTNLSGYARNDVQHYLDWLAHKKNSVATIHRIFNAIKNFSRWMKKFEAIEDIRIPKMKNYLQEAPVSLERNKRNELIRVVERSGNRRNFAIFIMMLYTGVRVSECAALDQSDLEISERKGSLKIRSGKGNKERTIPLHPEVRRAIKKYLETRNDDNPALFLSNRGKRISIRSIQFIFKKYGINSHQCRHTFISSLLREGKDLPLIQILTGHESISMLLRYGKPSENDKQNAVDCLFLNS